VWRTVVKGRGKLARRRQSLRLKPGASSPAKQYLDAERAAALAEVQRRERILAEVEATRHDEEPIDEESVCRLAAAVLIQAGRDLREWKGLEDTAKDLAQKTPKQLKALARSRQQQLDELMEWFFKPSREPYSFEIICHALNRHADSIRASVLEVFNSDSTARALRRRKLTVADIYIIRWRRKRGETRAKIAAEYGIHPGHVSRICVKTAWKQAKGPKTRACWNHQSKDRPR
jgi:hypothetical protein